MISRLSKFTFVILLSGCSSATIKISTNPPGADVYIKTVGQSERQLAGKTPLAQTTLSEIQKGKVGGAIMIELEKEGYLPTSVLVAETGGAAIEISQELKMVGADGSTNGKSADLNKGLDQLFEAQRLARVGRLDDSLKILDEVSKIHPNISAIPEMRGGIYYLQKNFSKSLDEYRKAVSLNAENATAKQMVKRLETQLGASSETRTPASAPAGSKASKQ